MQDWIDFNTSLLGNFATRCLTEKIFVLGHFMIKMGSGKLGENKPGRVKTSDSSQLFRSGRPFVLGTVLGLTRIDSLNNYSY